MRQTQLGLLVVAILQPLEESGEVRAAAAHDLADLVVAHARNARLLDDGVSQLGIGHAQAELGLLGVFHLWEVQLEEIFEVVGARGLGDVVDLVEGHRRGGEGLETLELDHLAEAGHVAAVSEDRRSVSVSAGGMGVDPKKIGCTARTAARRRVVNLKSGDDARENARGVASAGTIVARSICFRAVHEVVRAIAGHQLTLW